MLNIGAIASHGNSKLTTGIGNPESDRNPERFTYIMARV